MILFYKERVFIKAFIKGSIFKCVRTQIFEPFNLKVINVILKCPGSYPSTIIIGKMNSTVLTCKKKGKTKLF